MKRRKFLWDVGAVSTSIWAASGLRCLGLQTGSTALGALRWRRETGNRLFADVLHNGRSLLSSNRAGVVDAWVRVSSGTRWKMLRAPEKHSDGAPAPLRVQLRHELHRFAPEATEDLLEATVVVENDSSEETQVEIAFVSSVMPQPGGVAHRVYVPLSASGLGRDKRFTALGVEEFLQNCDQPLDPSPFVCHYLEPMASHPEERRTRGLLLVPVVHCYAKGTACRVALFGKSDTPRKFESRGTDDGGRIWQLSRVVCVPPGGKVCERCWLLIHAGDASVAWQAFHRFAHHEEFPAIDWIQQFRVQYYDFLSAAGGKNGHRGDGYEADLPFFRAFHVGMATQHGYYPTLGDYIQPDRQRWVAMRGDQQGPVEMSFEKMKERIRATRAAGAKAAIYLHPVLFDDATPFFERMRDCVLVGEDGQPVPFPWKGPDTVGRNWRASLASPEWRAHLLQQAEWIMEILEPDAITVDETFAGLGYDWHPDRRGAMSAGAIDFYRKLRALVRSYGADKAVFSSDCSDAAFVLWMDGEVGDHAYPSLLGHPFVPPGAGTVFGCVGWEAMASMCLAFPADVEAADGFGSASRCWCGGV